MNDKVMVNVVPKANDDDRENGWVVVPSVLEQIVDDLIDMDNLYKLNRLEVEAVIIVLEQYGFAKIEDK